MRSNMMRIGTGLAAPLMLVFALVACGGGGGGGGGTPPASSVIVTACTGTFISVNAVGVTSFAPSPVTISVNQIVEWDNTSGFDHTVTSTTVPANGTFNVALNNGTSVCLKFTAPGTFNYHCSIHPVMTGTVIVN